MNASSTDCRTSSSTDCRTSSNTVKISHVEEHGHKTLVHYSKGRARVSRLAGSEQLGSDSRDDGLLRMSDSHVLMCEVLQP
jgi:hypothetical protein